MYGYPIILLTGGMNVTSTEQEEMLLLMLEQAGSAVRKLKNELRQMCSAHEYVKGSTILELCDRIENEQNNFVRLDEMLTELENA